MNSLGRDIRPDSLTDRQYEIYNLIAFQLPVPDWPRTLLDSFGTETQTPGTVRGYVAQWIRNNSLEHVEKQLDYAITLVVEETIEEEIYEAITLAVEETIEEEIYEAITLAVEETWKHESTPECPHCGTAGRVTPSSMSQKWYCYRCGYSFHSCR